MPWDFETDPEFQQKLDWMRGFIDVELKTVRQKLSPSHQDNCSKSAHHDGPIGVQAKNYPLKSISRKPRRGHAKTEWRIR